MRGKHVVDKWGAGESRGPVASEDGETPMRRSRLAACPCRLRSQRRSPSSLNRQVRKDCLTDYIIAEHGFVLPKTEILQPGPDVHGRLHSAREYRLQPVVCKASLNCAT